MTPYKTFVLYAQKLASESPRKSAVFQHHFLKGFIRIISCMILQNYNIKSTLGCKIPQNIIFDIKNVKEKRPARHSSIAVRSYSTLHPVLLVWPIVPYIP